MESLLKVFSDKKFSLPILRKDCDYVNQLTSLLDEYAVVLDEQNIRKSIVEDVKIITNELVGVINLYYDGYMFQSYARFKKLMDTYQNILKVDTNSKDSESFHSFSKVYRTRVVNDYREHSRAEIFHVPYSKRTAIDNSRYSIAGYPSLYLSTTIDLCHYESGGSNNNFKIFSKYALVLEAIKEVVILDFGVRPKDLSKLNGEEIENYMRAYPIIAAASFIKQNQHQKFVPEYIIAQFVLQWLRETYVSEDRLCGVRYFSSRALTNADRGYNYVFPTYSTSTSKNNHCEVLSRSWAFTEPLITSKENDDFEDLSLIEKQLGKKPLNTLK